MGESQTRVLSLPKVPKSRLTQGILATALLGLGVFLLAPATTCERPKGDQQEFECVRPVVFAIFVGLPSLAVAIPLGLFAVLRTRRIRPIAVASAIVPMFVALGVLFNYSPLVLRLLLLLVAVAGAGDLVQRLHRR